MTDSKKTGRGDAFKEPTHVGLKMERELELRFIDKAKQLKALGYKTNKSDLIRRLAEYWLDDAEDLFAEWKNKRVSGE